VVGRNSRQPKHRPSQSPKLKVCNLHSTCDQGFHQGTSVHYKVLRCKVLRELGKCHDFKEVLTRRVWIVHLENKQQMRPQSADPRVEKMGKWSVSLQAMITRAKYTLSKSRDGPWTGLV
jgi:hypothetical protein